MRTMFRRVVITAGVALVASTLLSAQAAAAPQAKDAKAKADDMPVTLSGCVNRDPHDPMQFTLSESETGDKYRLSGKNLKQWDGRRVLVTGGPDRRRLVIRGGLYPSANVAAQAGALDPAKMAIAAQPGGTVGAGTGEVQLPEFRVARVKLADGSCK